MNQARDEKAEEYGKAIVDNMHSLGTYNKADFKAGWDAALEFLRGKEEPFALSRLEVDIAKSSINLTKLDHKTVFELGARYQYNDDKITIFALKERIRELEK